MYTGPSSIFAIVYSGKPCLASSHLATIEFVSCVRLVQHPHRRQVHYFSIVQLHQLMFIIYLQTLPLQPVVTYPEVRPGQLWAEEWTPQPTRYGGLFDMADLTKSIFETASSGLRPHPLVIEGFTIEGCAENLIAEIKKAVIMGNFAPLLPSDCTFQM